MLGMEEIWIFGEVEEEIWVEVDLECLVLFGFSVVDVVCLIISVDVKVFVGEICMGVSDFGVEIDGEFDGIDCIWFIVLIDGLDGCFVCLGDVVEVSCGECLLICFFVMING